MIDLHLRIKTPVVWLNKADDLGLRENYIVTPAVLDEGGNEVEPAVIGQRFKRGVNIYQIPVVYTQKPAYDSEWNLVSPGVESPAIHLNIRIDNQEVEDELGAIWEEVDGQRQPSGQATPAPRNKNEVAWNWRGVELVDMTTVNSPENVWL